MKELDVKVGGYVFTDDEIQSFFAYLKTLLQHHMTKLPQGSVEKYELSICNTTLGKPGEGERTSIPQSSFRRDLTIVCECAGVTGSQLFVSNDQRFLNTVAHSNVVRGLFKKAARKHCFKS